MYSVGREFMVNIKQSKRVSSPRDMTTKKGSRLDKIAFGFVRQSEKLLDSNMFVPEPLTRLCMQFATEEEHAYFGIYDELHSNIEFQPSKPRCSSKSCKNKHHDHPSQVLTGNGQSDPTADVAFLSQVGFNSGVHEIVMESIKSHPNDKIGICQNVNPEQLDGLGKIYLYDAVFGERYYWWQHTRKIWTQSTHHKEVEKRIKWKDGDIIKMVLDCDNWTLAYTLNDEVVVKPFKITPNITYYPVLTNGDTRCQYRHILPASCTCADRM